MIKIISHLAAVVVMTVISAILLLLSIFGFVLFIGFVVWEAPSFNLEGLAPLFRLGIVFGLPFGIWFACAKEGREFAAEFESNINKWFSKNDH